MAPRLPGVTEYVGDFGEAEFARSVIEGADAVVSTVHPIAGDRESQRGVIAGTTLLARAASAVGVDRLVHISTAQVYDRSPGVGDVDESSALVGDDAATYAVAKRDVEVELAKVHGLTRVLLRPPAIFGPGESSMFNAVIPAEFRDDEQARHAVPQTSLPWVHVNDLAVIAADLAAGQIADADDPALGPVPGECTPVNVAAGPATDRDYYETLAGALGVGPVWEETDAWTGQILTGRARGWGWAPTVDLDTALAEIAAGLR